MTCRVLVRVINEGNEGNGGKTQGKVLQYVVNALRSTEVGFLGSGGFLDARSNFGERTTFLH